MGYRFSIQSPKIVCLFKAHDSSILQYFINFKSVYIDILLINNFQKSIPQFIISYLDNTLNFRFSEVIGW